MIGATLVREIDISLNDEVDVLWCVQLIIDHGLEAAHVDRIKINASGLGSIKCKIDI
jgi:hypothetical protein